MSLKEQVAQAGTQQAQKSLELDQDLKNLNRSLVDIQRSVKLEHNRPPECV